MIFDLYIKQPSNKMWKYFLTTVSTFPHIREINLHGCIKTKKTKTSASPFRNKRQ